MVTGRPQRGIGLIELMVVLALTLLVALGGTALNRTWVDRTALSHTQAQLHQAMGELKAVALRNPGSQAMGQPAAVLLSLDGQLCVFGAVPAQRSCADALWRSRPSARIEFTNQQANNACLAMNSAGMLLTSPVAGLNCGINLNYNLARNSEELPGRLD